jgi:hypothetical protein
MGRPDLDMVRQTPEDLFLDRVTELPCGLPRLVGASEEVGPGEIPHQQRSAGQHEGRLVPGRSVVYQEAHVLGGVSGRMNELETHVPDLDHLAVFHLAVFVTEVCIGVSEQFDALSLAQLAQSGQVVVVTVCVDGKRDPKSLAARGLEIALDVPPGVQDERSPGGLVSDEVRGVPKALQIELLEEHQRA